MPGQANISKAAPFIQEGGEMGRLIRSYDWSRNALGTPDQWPQSLRTALNIVLRSRFPMFLWWGPDLICFYNDAYRPSLGINGKHPSILGQPAEKAWPEIWDIIKPLIDNVLNTGEGTWSEDQLIPIYRNGKIEDVYWTFSYSPIIDENDAIGGVLVTCTETTDKVEALRKLEESEKRFRNTVMHAPVGILSLRGPQFRIEAINEAFLSMIDKKESVAVGKLLFEVSPETEINVKPLLEKVYQTGQPHTGTEFEVTLNRKKVTERAYFNFIYQPMFDDNNKVTGITMVASEVTREVFAKQRLQERERQFSEIVLQSPLAIAILRGSDLIVEMANNAMLKKILRRPEKDVIGKSILKLFPGESEHKFISLLNQVMATGKTYRESDAEINIEGDDGFKKFYLDLEYLPLLQKDGLASGIIVSVHDVTEKVIVRKKIEENEKKLNIVIEAGQLGIFELDLETDSIAYSERSLDIMGYKAATGLTHDQLVRHIHPDDLETRRQAFDRALETGILHYQTRIIWSDQTIHYMEANGKVFYDQHGKPVRLMGTLRDITNEKFYEHELQEREKRFRKLADIMPQFVWTADRNGNFDYYNKAVYDYTGLNTEQLSGSGLLQVIHPEDRELNFNTWQTSVKTGEPFLMEHRFRRHDGEYGWRLSRAVPFHDHEGKIQMWVGTSTDIDDIKRHQQEKDDFIKIASHELKTPVTTIKAYVQLLLEQKYSSEFPILSKSLSTIDKQVSKLSRLINDLLDITKIELGSFFPVKETLSLTDLVNDVVHQLQATTRTHKLEVTHSESIIVNADKDRITQVLINLVTNAIKYSPGADRVVIHTFRQKDQAIVSIRDYGIGLQSKHREKIFNRFFRVENPDGKIIPGFGLGLFIVKEIISRHEGRIWVESEPGAGSTFYFSLPSIL